MTTEKKSPAGEEKKVTEKPIDLEESDLEQVTGGTARRNVVEDPCQGGEIRKR